MTAHRRPRREIPRAVSGLPALVPQASASVPPQAASLFPQVAEQISMLPQQITMLPQRAKESRIYRWFADLELGPLVVEGFLLFALIALAASAVL